MAFDPDDYRAPAERELKGLPQVYTVKEKILAIQFEAIEAKRMVSEMAELLEVTPMRSSNRKTVENMLTTAKIRFKAQVVALFDALMSHMNEGEITFFREIMAVDGKGIPYEYAVKCYYELNRFIRKSGISDFMKPVIPIEDSWKEGLFT